MFKNMQLRIERCGQTCCISNSRTQVLSISLAVQASWPFSSQHCKQLPSAEKPLCEQARNSIDTSVRWRWCRAYCLETKSFWLYDASLWWQSIMLLWLCLMSWKIPFNEIVKSWWGDRWVKLEAGPWIVLRELTPLCLFCLVVCFHVPIAERNPFHFWLLQYFNPGRLFRDENVSIYMFICLHRKVKMVKSKLGPLSL